MFELGYRPMPAGDGKPPPPSHQPPLRTRLDHPDHRKLRDRKLRAKSSKTRPSPQRSSTGSYATRPSYKSTATATACATTKPASPRSAPASTTPQTWGRLDHNWRILAILDNGPAVARDAVVVSAGVRRTSALAVETVGVDVVVLGQPDKGGGAVGEELRAALRWPDATDLWLAVAWAKRSGLRLIEPELQDFRTGQRVLRAIIGVDQHGGTVEGLELALALFTEARVYHDANPRRTFHPKLYVVEAPARARVIVGSGNLTGGGLYGNYEVSLRLDLRLDRPEDETVLAGLRAWFEARWSNLEASLLLSKSSIQSLIDDPSIVVAPERWAPVLPAPVAAPHADARALFRRAVKGLAQPPRVAGAEDVDGIDGLAELARARGEMERRDGARVLAAGLPRDRWGQAGFNRTVAEDFFGALVNGDSIHVQAVTRNRRLHPWEERRLIFAPGNRNHRFELPEPEGRSRPAGESPIVLLHEVAWKRFRYIYLLPEDPGYHTIAAAIRRREGVGTSRKPETRRVYLTLGWLRDAWPECPLVSVVSR